MLRERCLGATLSVAKQNELAEQIESGAHGNLHHCFELVNPPQGNHVNGMFLCYK